MNGRSVERLILAIGGRAMRYIVKPSRMLLILLLLAAPELVLAGIRSYSPSSYDDPAEAAARKANREAISAATSVANYHQAAVQQRLAALKKAPWRIVKGATNNINDPGWFHFAGRVLRVYPGCIRVEGSISSLATENNLGRLDTAGSVMKAPMALLPGNVLTRQIFVVTNFPYVLASGDTINFLDYHMAKDAGVFAAPTTSTNHTERTDYEDHEGVHKYDYGKICPPPQWFIEAEAAKAAKAKQTAMSATLKLDQEKAAEGRPLYHYRLGQRYLTGNGVETNLAKARELFQKSADQGNADAAAELKKLSQNAAHQAN